LNDRCEHKDEKGKEYFVVKPGSEEVNLLDAQDQDDRGTGQQILHCKECQGTLFQIISHDGVQFLGPTAHQLKGEVSISNRERDDAKYRGKNPRAMGITKGEFTHFAIVSEIERDSRAVKWIDRKADQKAILFSILLPVLKRK